MLLSARHFSVRRISAIVVAVCLLGSALRIFYALRCGVGYDEVFVMGVGLDELRASWFAFLIDVPVRRSDAITPLWWWVQSIPVASTDHLSLIGLRTLPVVLGSATLLLTWWAAKRRIGRGPAVILLVFTATSDVLAFANCRGEFAETLLVMIGLPAICMVGLQDYKWTKGLLWCLLIMTHLGKGACWVAGLGMAEVIWILCSAQRRRSVRPLLASFGAALVPVIGWLAVVNARAFSSGEVATDAGPRDSVWQSLVEITMGYRQTKKHMVAAPFDTLQVFLDAAVWPLTTIMAGPLVFGFVAAMVMLVCSRTRGRRHELVLSLAPWVLLVAAAVVLRGLVGSRFHLLYLPPLWLIASIGLWWVRSANPLLLVLAVVLWVGHLCVAEGWSSWSERTIDFSGHWPAFAATLAGAFGVACWHQWDRRRGQLGLLVATAVMIGAASWMGPARWGAAARFEPMNAAQGSQEQALLAAIDSWRKTDAPYPPANGRSLYIDLSNYYLLKADVTQEDIAKAVDYAELETRRVPDDARAWFYAGLAYQRQGRPADQIRRVWEKSYTLRANPGLKARLDALSPHAEG